MKRVGIFRSGAYGDLMFASSVFKGYKDLGWHVTLICAKPSNVIIFNDPNIDEILLHDMTIPQADLPKYWEDMSKNYDRFVNLSASIECEWLQLPGQPTYNYPFEVRKQLYDHNYLEHNHLLAQLENKNQIRFYPTNEEIEDVKQIKSTFKETKTLVWVLSGSSVHKCNPHINTFIANMLKIEDLHIFLVGSTDQDCLAAGLKNVDRVTSLTLLDIRTQYTFVQQYADVLCGPETGIMVAMCNEPFKKIVFLSHSTENMLTKDWINTTSLQAKVEDLSCGGCCRYRLSEGDDVIKYENTQYACCQALQPMHLAFESAVKTLL